MRKKEFGPEFDDLRRVRCKVAEANPRWFHSDVDQAWPTSPRGSIGKRAEIQIEKPLQFGADRFICHAFILDRAFGTCSRRTDHEREPRIASEIRRLSRRVEGVEEDFEAITDNNANDGGLRITLWGSGSLDCVSLLAHEGK